MQGQGQYPHLMLMVQVRRQGGGRGGERVGGHTVFSSDALPRPMRGLAAVVAGHPDII